MRIVPSLRLAPAAVALALVASCFSSARSGSSFAPTNAPPRPLGARSPQSVEIYTLGAPPRPHVEVGVIRAYGQGDATVTAMNVLRTKAAEVGCDAVVVTTTISYQGALAYHAACLVYVDAAPAAPAATSPAS